MGSIKYTCPSAYTAHSLFLVCYPNNVSSKIELHHYLYTMFGGMEIAMTNKDKIKISVSNTDYIFSVKDNELSELDSIKLIDLLKTYNYPDITFTSFDYSSNSFDLYKCSVDN